MSTLVAFAIISTLCEAVLLAGLRMRPDIESLPRWTELPLIAEQRNHGVIEVLFVELSDDRLPSGLLVLRAATGAAAYRWHDPRCKSRHALYGA